MGLIKAEGSDKFVVVHTLVYRYIQDKLDLPAAIRTAMMNNYDNYLKEAATNQAQWPEIDQELIHIIGIIKLAIKTKQYQKAVELIDQIQPQPDSQDSYEYYLDNNGDYLEKLEILQLRLKAIEEAIKEAIKQQESNQQPSTKYQPQDIADCHILIGGLEQKFANYDQAFTHFKTANEIYLSHLGNEHEKTALAIHSIANVYDRQGQYDRALEQYQIALRIEKAKLGEDHPSVADTINNIACVYGSQGQYDQALEQYQIALRIKKAKLGEDHPSVADTINNIKIAESKMKKKPSTSPTQNQATNPNTKCCTIL